jgi:prevent-host-death family protein
MSIGGDAMTWHITSAKQQFSEVVRLAAQEPQAIYNRDRPVAVLISANEFEGYQRVLAAQRMDRPNPFDDPQGTH